MRVLILFACLLWALPAAAQRQWLLSADTWFAPRDGRMIVGLKPVAAAVTAWAKHPHSRLVIRYPGGEAGTLWGRELRDWLVSLGVPSSHVQTSPGFSRQDAVAIVLRGPRESYP